MKYKKFDSIEGHPFITRFKTEISNLLSLIPIEISIEGHPFITRFKTGYIKYKS